MKFRDLTKAYSKQLRFVGNSASPCSMRIWTGIIALSAMCLGAQPEQTDNIARLTQAAEAGDIKSQLALGNYYADFRNREHSDAAALLWLNKASKAGNTNAVAAIDKLQKAFGDNRRSLILILSSKTNQAAAEAGNPMAMYWWGKKLLSSKETDQTGQGIEWLQKSAASGFVAAMNDLGDAYRLGAGGRISKDASKSTAWYGKAAEVGSIYSMERLVRLFETERVDGVLKSQIVLLLQKCTEAGSDEALKCLAAINRDKSLSETIRAQNQAVFLKHANAGSSQAMYEIGRMLDYSDKPGDLDEAVGWLIKAAERSHPDAIKQLGKSLNDLGFGYEMGLGKLPKDQVKASKYYRLGAEKGHPECMTKLGELLLTGGNGVTANPAEALNWYRKAIDLGHTKAMTELGEALATGRGAEKNETEALLWFRKAADKGDTSAMISLGIMLGEGWGVASNETEAVQWLCKAVSKNRELNYRNRSTDESIKCIQVSGGALYGYNFEIEKKIMSDVASWFSKEANAGNGEAMYCLGLMFQQGQGVQTDKARGALWIEKASQADYKPKLKHSETGR